MSNVSCPQCGGQVEENTSGAPHMSAGELVDGLKTWLECLDCNWRDELISTADPIQDYAEARMCAAFGTSL